MESTKRYSQFDWIDVASPTSAEIAILAQRHQLDMHQANDCIEPGHLPKIEKQEAYTFVILRAHATTHDADEVTITGLSNKIAFFIFPDKIITIHRSSFEFLSKVKSDYARPETFFLHIVQLMLESYEVPLNALDQQIEQFEHDVFLSKQARVSLQQLYYIKSQTRVVKKVLQICQSVALKLEVTAESNTALEDVRDRFVQLILRYDEVLENATGLMNSYHSINAQKNNDVMKMLTVFSAFFLPLTFIAGIYGMNFIHMPELQWENGYYAVWGFMLVMCILIYAWFRRKKIL